MRLKYAYTVLFIVFFLFSCTPRKNEIKESLKIAEVAKKVYIVKQYSVNEFRIKIKRVLNKSNIYSKNLEELLLATAICETELGKYHKQIGGGPAVGIFQILPSTEKCLWKNYLKYKPQYVYRRGNLMYDIDYQIWLAAIYYKCRAEWHNRRLPNHANINEIAVFWKEFYNTNSGKGTVDGFINKYKEFINNV